MEFSDGHNDGALLLPIARLPEYPLMIVMTYLQGVYKPPSGQNYPASQGRNWRHRSKLVVPTSYDADWYRPLGPVTGVNFTPEMFELLDRQMRWTSMSALRLTCKSFWVLSEKVVPLFSLLRQLRTGSIQLGAIPRPLTIAASLMPEETQNMLKLVTPTELDLVLTSGVKSGVLKPQLFRSKSSAHRTEPRAAPTAVKQENSSSDLMPPLPPSEWYGTLSRQVHIAFEPLILPSAYDAPFTALQIASASQRHLSALRRSAGPPSEELGRLAAQTSVDYFIGEHRKRMEEDCETHIRFRLKVELKGDKEMDAPPRYLHFKSVVIQATSFVHERTETDAKRDPLNLSPYFIRRSNAMPMRPPQGYVGLHSLAVETEDAVLAAELQLPPPGSGCSTIVTMIENGARGILEVHTRADPHVFVPVVIIRTDFLNSLAKLRGMPGETAQELQESVKVISQWLSLVSMVDYSTPAAPQKLSDLERMYSYSFMDLETPLQGPLSPSYILNPHAFYLQPAIARFLGANVEEEYFSSSTELLSSTHTKPLSTNLTQFYHRSIESILEQFRWSHIVLPAIEFLAKQDLDFALHGPLSTLCSRTKILDHTEVDLQRMPHSTHTPLDIIPCTMYSTFEIRTTAPNISIRFTHRRYPMALSVSVVAPTTLEAWQWASKNRVLLNYFHYGCTPFYVPMPDLSHLSERYADVLSVSLLPTVPGAPQPSWTSDPLITNATLASTSVNCLEELEGRDSVCILRWDPSVTLEEWRKSANQSYGVPLDLHLVETLAAATGVPELSCDQFMTLIIRVFGQGFGNIPSEGDLRKSPSDASSLEIPMQRMSLDPSTTEDTLISTPKVLDSASSSGTEQNDALSAPILETSTLSLEFEEETSNVIMGEKIAQNDVSPQYPSNFNRMKIYERASVFRSKDIPPPFGTTNIYWRPTVLIVETPDTNWDCHSISMMAPYANLSNEQLRWADYNLLHPVDYGLSEPQAKSQNDSKQIHPENVFVDPAVIGIYPNLVHKVYTENGIPFTLLMSSGERVASLQMVESRRKTTPLQATSVDFLSSVNASKGMPKYSVADSTIDSSEPPQYCVVWRRTYADYIVSSHFDLLSAKSIFAAKFQSFTGQPWTLNCHTEGWTVTKSASPSNPWKARQTVFPPHYLEPTFLDPAILYECVSLKEGPNDFWSYLMPISSALRYWARFYRIVLADLPLSLEMIKLALLNDEPGMEDRVLSLMEYAEWCRACGDLKGTLEAVDAANVENSLHPLPLLAKADLSCLASLQCMDPKTEVQLIEQSVSLYTRFLTSAQRITSLHARFSPNFRQASKDAQAADLVPSGDEKGEQDTSGEAVAVATSSESTPSGSLAAQTPSVTPLSVASVLAYKNPLSYKAPMPPSLVHMRRAQWAVGKLYQRLDRHSEAKACYDELLRKYYKRERLELTLDRCSVLLALKKPKEAAETMEHALQKELVNNLSTTYAHSIYYRHVTALKARGFLLLAAALLANQSYEAAARALMTHRFYDPAEPRSAVVGSFLSLARSAPKQDLRTRMRIHGAQLFGFRNNPPNPAVGAPVNPVNPANLQVLAGQQVIPAQPVVLAPPVVGGPQAVAAQGAINPAINPVPVLNPVMAVAHNAAANLARLPPGLGQGHAQAPPAAVGQRVIRPVANPKHPHPANRPAQLPPAQQTPPPSLNTNAVLAYLRSPDPFGYIARDAARRVKSSNAAISSSSQVNTSAAAHSNATTPQTQLLVLDDSVPPSPSGLEPSSTEASSSLDNQQWFSVKSPSSKKRGKLEASSSAASPSSSSMATPTPSSSSMAMDSGETAIKGIGSDSEEEIDNANSGEFTYKLPTSSDSPGPEDIVPSSTPSELAARRIEELNSPSSAKLTLSSDDSVGPQSSSFNATSDDKSADDAEAVPTHVRNGATWKRFYGFVRYQNWELLTPLLEMMVDASMMKRRLLHPRRVKQQNADEILLLPESTFLAALTILEHIRDLVDQGNLLKAATNDPDQQVKLEKLEKEISEAENQYFEAMPSFRRLRISFFIASEIQYIRSLIDAAFACSILQRALQLKHAVESSTDPTNLHSTDNASDYGGVFEPTITASNKLETTNASSSASTSQAPGSSQPVNNPMTSALESSKANSDATQNENTSISIALGASVDPTNPYPSLWSYHLLNRILNMTAPSFSAFSNPLVSTPFPISAAQTATEKIENLFSSFPTKYALDILAEEVTLAPLDRRTAKMQQILNAVGRRQALRIISVTRKKPTQKPYVRSRAPTSPEARQNEFASHIQPMGSVSIPPIIQNASPPTLLWHFVASFSLPRILMKGLELNCRKSVRSLTFSTALDKFELKMPHVAILVEVQLGNVFYCGPEQKELPPGYDSLAIVNRFTTLQEDDGSISFLPQNNDSAVPVFKVFDQAQVGSVRYIIQGADSLPAAHLRAMAP